ncbi:MAG: pYEATS domain-containing protein [Terriglobia bacterium]
MPLSIEQGAQYLGNERWKWWVWVEGTAAELDDIGRVVYVLHPTFHNPVREIKDRSSKFRLETSGWGTFRIHAKAVHLDGHETPLEHNLVLVYPDGTPTPA